MSTNPFNLAALRDIWIQEGSLPDETHLMKSLIDLRIQTDVCHVYSQSVKQRQKQSEIRKAFQHIALIMQCVHRFYLSNEEINELFDNETQDILLCHGLWNSTNEGLRGFAHNNYREYLAAEALSRLDLTHILGFIANPPNQLTIRPTWINVLSYLADLYRPSDLKNWIFEKQPKLILMFEKDRFTENQRTSVIKQIIDKSKKQDSWILMNHSYMSDLAAYCSTSEAVQYIVDELQQVQTQRHKQNLLRCLSYFPEYYSFEDIIKGIIINIAFNNSEDLYVKCDAFRVMSSHPDLFHDYIDNAVELIRQQVNEYLIYEVIVFIKETGKAEDYKQAKERMTLPDMVNEPCIPEVTEAIHEITSPTCIHILIDLFTLSYTPGFIDQEGFVLKSVCWSVIKNIARVDYEATQKALTAAITTEKSDTNTALKDLLYSIKDEQPYMQDTPLDFDFAKQLVLGM